MSNDEEKSGAMIEPPSMKARYTNELGRTVNEDWRHRYARGPSSNFYPGMRHLDISTLPRFLQGQEYTDDRIGKSGEFKFK
ncbi:hypothetical protein JL36_07240 [Lactococcus cremoris]|nr:hypothetical protein JL36_07240 [Lactococcus cremoris]